MSKLSDLIKIRIIYAWLPKWLEDEKRYAWLEEVWRVDNSLLEEFMALGVITTYYKQEKEARNTLLNWMQ